MSYVVSGLPLESFQPMFGLSDAALADRGVIRQVADKLVGYPCRVTLQDAALGETVLLLNFEHQPAATPFRSSHAIYVREQAEAAASFVDRAPDALKIRAQLSVRAFDASGMLIGAEVTAGADVEAAVGRGLQTREAAYLHVHNAALGCYLARVDRA